MRTQVVVAAGLCAAFVHAVTLRPGATEVVLAPQAPQPVVFAAQELQMALSQVFGAEVPVVSTPTAGRCPIFLGTNAWSQKAGLAPERLPRDGFETVAVAGAQPAVYLAGCDDEVDVQRALKGNIWRQYYQRGTYFAVIDFLERFVGCRFYFPGEIGTIVPRRSTVHVQPGRRKTVPAMSLRRFSHYSFGILPDGRTGAAANPYVNHHAMRLRMETDLGPPCCHGQAKFRYPERFGATHPEYFALENGKRLTMTEGHMVGQLCHSSAVWDELYEDVTSYLRGEPARTRGIIGWDGKNYGWSWQFRGRICDIMPQDGLRVCQCALCKANFGGTKEGLGEFIWKRTAEFANRLKADGFADAKVTQSAYGHLQRVPKVNLPSNVVVAVTERGPWSFATPQELNREVDEIAAWQRKLGGRKTWIWTYIDKYGAMKIPNIPCGTPRACAAFYRQAAPFVYGIFAESEVDRFLYNALDAYVLSRICWDPSVDTEEVIAEFFAKMFGKAAEEMARISDLLERKWLWDVAAHTVMTAVGPTARPPEERELWTSVYSPDVIADLTRRFDRASSSVGSDSIEGRRVALYRQEWLEPLVKAASDYLQNSDPQAALARDAASTRPQLVANGDFSETHGWHFDRRAPKDAFVLDTDAFVSPGRSLRMVSTNNSVIAMQYLDGKNGCPAMKPGGRYRLSFNLKLKGLEPVTHGGARVVVNDGVNNNFPPANSFVGSSEWTHYVYAFTAGPQTNVKTPAYVRIRIDGAAGTIWVDDVRIEELE